MNDDGGHFDKSKRSLKGERDATINVAFKSAFATIKVLSVDFVLQRWETRVTGYYKGRI